MVDVRLIEPGSDESLPEPADENAYAFDPETRKAFLRQAASLASGTDRRMFVATEDDLLVSVGLTKVCQVIFRDGDEVGLSDSHAWHPVASGVNLNIGDWYELAIEPGSNAILAVIRDVAPKVLTDPKGSYKIDPLSSDLPSVSGEDAKAFFSKVRRQPHIPFQYPANGCPARAQEMSRLIEEYFDPDPKNEVVVAKVWSFPPKEGGRITVKTENNYGCQVSWFYHVAPIVKVEKDLLVLDPSLFDRLVDIQGWQRIQRGSASLRFTTLEAYSHDKGDTFFGTPQKTRADLQSFWGELITLIYNRGPIPYKCS